MTPSTTTLSIHHLSAFLGTWKTEGTVWNGAGGPGTRFQATDTYEWLDGGAFLVHRWETTMPGGDAVGIEIIGYDPTTDSFPMYAFDSDGNTTILDARVNGPTWTFNGVHGRERIRFTGRFHDDGRRLAGIWERRPSDAADWLPWIDVTLRRETNRDNGAA